MSENRIALVTGAGSGIGRQVALALLERGYTVAAAGRTIQTLEGTRDLARARQECIIPMVADVTVAASIDRLFAEITSRFGRLDLLFNNAGTDTPGVPIDELGSEQVVRIVSTNLIGATLVARGAFHLMKTQIPGGGRIINNGSVSAQVPRFNSAAYTVSKHGMTGLTRSLSLDGRVHSIACGQIDLGNVDTKMGSRMVRGVPQASGEIRAEPVIDARYAVEAICFMAGLPLEANVQFMTLMATGMPFIGRG